MHEKPNATSDVVPTASPPPSPPPSYQPSTPDGSLNRTFTPRHVHIISLGGNIGSGLFVATGSAYATGGPASVMLGYAIVGSAIWAVLNTIGEMTIAFPTTGNFVDYADRWVDPAVGFGVGFAEWFGWSTVVAAEATFFNVVVNYWADGAVHEAVWLTVFIVLVFGLMSLPNKYFAWFEYVASILKIAALVIFVVAMFAMVLGAGPTGHAHHGETWTRYPAFKNGFQGFGNCLLLALWAMGDQIFTGIMGGEAESPRYAIAHATKLVPIRCSAIYLLVMLFVTLLIPSTDPRLFGNSGTTASPMVIAAVDAGIPGLPDFLNVIIIIGVAAVAAESIYLCSRILRSMAHQRLIPAFIAKVDGEGRPRWALGITGCVSLAITYINLCSSGSTVYTWLSSITSSTFFLVWIVIIATSFRFRAALAAQNDALFSEPYAWKCVLWPWTPLYLATICGLLMASLVYVGLLPDGPGSTSVYSFFEYMIGVVITVSATLFYKLAFGTRMRDPRTADLKTGRRTLGADELRGLDAYYAKAGWRRLGSYLQIW
ncbi:hypothetical protein K490DRAFT_33007 [Saccharata proteae CBS 121410]|uniref:Amino acid permease/ SLC12A domain-containing protein n=1 Tax=Saccharata proteae CBS 121410 TaxID=1314787 RepID=A0A9P4LZ62_9PEZI|nr:hypothetical protein K490DRAFT_33007 [Saccharata proteae CBS 121410]